MECRTRCCATASLCALAAILLFIAPAFAQAPAAPNKVPPPQQWPQEFIKNGNRLLIYQPQLQDWRNFRELTADTAISLTPAGGKSVMGVVSWQANTVADTQTRLVVIKDIVVTGARFPSLDPATAATMERNARETYTSTAMTTSLDRMLASFHTAQAPAPSPISTDPPPIFVSNAPAILLFVDGDPVRVPITGTDLTYIVNTTWTVLCAGQDYYLLADKTWLKARTLSGPWTATTQVPLAKTKLPADSVWDDVREALPPSAATSVPRVLYTAKPAELVVFTGKPAFKKISGTGLSYAGNSESDVFRDDSSGKIYLLLSGRWFRADSIHGPWTYAGNDLPGDFARIPPDHPRGRVLVSVPGTQAARDAVLLARVPTTIVVNRAEAEAQVKVAYAGDPQFKPIQGTSLSYAANTQEKVVKVGDLYYLCFQGIWFVSSKPDGPWKTADSVPKEIYEIPPSSPVYNITYVTQTNPTSTTVESSYTSGYVGMFVLGAAVGACIAYGTGYYYPPYYWWGPYHPWPIYYPYPYSYGFRAVYNPATGFYAIGGAVYGPYGAAGRAAWYNPTTGNYGRAATVQTAWGGRTVAAAYNPWTGNSGITHQGWNQYAQWGSSVINHDGDISHTWHVATDNNIYAGKDGNVYRRDSNGNWSKYDDGNWVPVEKSQSGQRPGGDGSTQKARQDWQNATPQERQQQADKARQDWQNATPSERQQKADQARQDRQANIPADRQQQLDAARQSGQRERSGVEPATQRSRDDWSQQAASRRSSVSADTMQNLNRDYSARQSGAARERSFNRSMGSTSMPRGGRRR